MNTSGKSLLKLTLVAAAIASASAAHAGQYFEKGSTLTHIAAVKNNDPGIFKLQQVLPELKIEGTAAVAMQQFEWDTNTSLTDALNRFAKNKKLDIVWDGSRQAFIVQPEGLLKSKAAETNSAAAQETDNTTQGPGLLDSAKSAVTAVGGFLAGLNPFAKSDDSNTAKEAKSAQPAQVTAAAQPTSASVADNGLPYSIHPSKEKHLEAKIADLPKQPDTNLVPVKPIESVVGAAKGDQSKDFVSPAAGMKLNQALGENPVGNVAPASQEMSNNMRIMKEMEMRESLRSQTEQRRIEELQRIEDLRDQRRAEMQKAVGATANTANAAYSITASQPKAAVMPNMTQPQKAKPAMPGAAAPTAMQEQGAWQIIPGKFEDAIGKIATRYKLTAVYTGPSAVYVDRPLTLKGLSAEMDVADTLSGVNLPSGLSVAVKGPYLVVGSVDQIAAFNPAYPKAAMATKGEGLVLVKPSEEGSVLGQLFGLAPDVEEISLEEQQKTAEQLITKGPWSLRLQAGDDLQVHLARLLQSKNWNMVWSVGQGLRSKGVQSFNGETLPEFLGAFLPSLGLDARIDLAKREVEIVPLSRFGRQQ